MSGGLNGPPIRSRPTNSSPRWQTGMRRQEPSACMPANACCICQACNGTSLSTGLPAMKLQLVLTDRPEISALVVAELPPQVAHAQVDLVAGQPPAAVQHARGLLGDH